MLVSTQPGAVLPGGHKEIGVSGVFTLKCVSRSANGTIAFL